MMQSRWITGYKLKNYEVDKVSGTLNPYYL